MPELSRFYGIIIRMYCELGPHHSPHFHAYHRAALALQSVARGRPAMLSQETLDQYRRMTGIERRFEILKRENDARNRTMRQWAKELGVAEKLEEVLAVRP